MAGSGILSESQTFLHFFLLGIGMSLIYDILRLFRFLIRHNNICIAIEDLLFWIMTAVVVFLMFLKESNGSIRFFSIGAAVLGMILKNWLTVNIRSCKIFHKNRDRKE